MNKYFFAFILPVIIGCSPSQNSNNSESQKSLTVEIVKEIDYASYLESIRSFSSEKTSDKKLLIEALDTQGWLSTADQDQNAVLRWEAIQTLRRQSPAFHKSISDELWALAAKQNSNLIPNFILQKLSPSPQEVIENSEELLSFDYENDDAANVIENTLFALTHLEDVQAKEYTALKKVILQSHSYKSLNQENREFIDQYIIPDIELCALKQC